MSDATWTNITPSDGMNLNHLSDVNRQITYEYDNLGRVIRARVETVDHQDLIAEMHETRRALERLIAIVTSWQGDGK